MSKSRWAVLAGSVVIAITIGWFAFPAVSLERQFIVASFLATVGATLFAILGVWIAILNPLLLAAVSQQNGCSSRQDLAHQLLLPWIYATSVFALAVVTAFILGVAGAMWDGSTLARQIAGMSLTLLLCLLLYTLLGTLLPIAHLQREQRIRELREASRR